MDIELLDDIVNSIIEKGSFEVSIPKSLPKFWVEVNKRLGEDMETIAIVSALSLLWINSLASEYKKDGLTEKEVHKKMDKIMEVAGETVHAFMTAIIKERMEEMEAGKNETAH